MRLPAIVFCFIGLAQSIYAQSENEADKASELDHIEYVWNAMGGEGNFRVCILGSEIKLETIESKEVLEVLSRLPTVADGIVVGSTELEKAVSEYSDLKVFVADKFYDMAIERKGSAAHWVLIENDGEKIKKYISTHTAEDLITPRSERDKRQE